MELVHQSLGSLYGMMHIIEHGVYVQKITTLGVGWGNAGMNLHSLILRTIIGPVYCAHVVACERVVGPVPCVPGSGWHAHDVPGVLCWPCCAHVKLFVGVNSSFADGALMIQCN